MDSKKKTGRTTKAKAKKSTDPFARSDDESGKSEDETLFKSGSESESEEKVVTKKKIIKKKTIKKEDTIKEEDTKPKRESKFMYTQINSHAYSSGRDASDKDHSI